MSETTTLRVILSIAETMDTSVYNVEPTTHLRGQLGMDSLDLCNIILAIEENFAMEISDAEAEHWETVSDVITSVQRKMQ